MNFLARLKKSFTLRAKSLIGGAISWAGVDWGGYISSYGSDCAPRDVGAWLRAFKRVGQVRAVVNRIAEDVAAVPFHLYRRIDGPVGLDGKEPCEMVTRANAANEFEARLLELMRKPSPAMTGSRWRWLLVSWLNMCGFAPLLIEWETVGRVKVPKWLHPIPPQRIVGIPTKDKPYFQVRTAKGKTDRYSPEDIIWISYPDVEDPYGMGAAPALAVDDEVNQIAAKDVWNNNFFRQGAHPGAIVSVDGMTDAVKKQLETEWNSKYQGVHNAHKTLFLSTGKVTVNQMRQGHKDLDYVNGDQRLGDRVRFNWNMPPELVGDVRNSNRATIQGAEKVHQQGNLAPACLFLEENWNDYIVPLFPVEGLFVRYANPVKQTEEQHHLELTEGLEHGAVTRDEWRMGHKMDPWGAPHGNQYGQPLNTTWVSLDGPPVFNQPNEEDVTRAFAAFAKALHRGGEGYRPGGQASNGSPGVFR